MLSHYFTEKLLLIAKKKKKSYQVPVVIVNAEMVSVSATEGMLRVAINLVLQLTVA